MKTSTTPNVPPYRGRVRTGCLTCRERKVRCDEARPICNNCAKKSRNCVFPPKKTSCVQTAAQSTGIESPINANDGHHGQSSPSASITDSTYPTPSTDHSNVPLVTAHHTWTSVNSSIISPIHDADAQYTSWSGTPQNHEELVLYAVEHEAQSSSPSTFISRDINLTTTIDKLTATESPQQSWAPFFIESADCPWISPYDALNWRRAKLMMVQLGEVHSPVSSAIIAVTALYKAQLHGLPTSAATKLFRHAACVYHELCLDEAMNFDIILVTVFLLTLFASIDYESIPILRDSDQRFLSKTTEWVQNKTTHSALATRLLSWLRLLHAVALRGGGSGLLSAELDRILPMSLPGLSNSKLPDNNPADASVSLIETLSSPVFDFYFRLQMVSSELPKLTHYHRTRNSWSDQEEVVKYMADIKQRLRALWNERPATLFQSAQDLRALLAPAVAEPIVALVNVVTAAYHVEFIEMDRILGDPVSRGGESIEAMASFRALVNSEFAPKPMNNLNPAYLRPLFLYAIECMDALENDWAVEKMRQIRDPICRSDFFASFGAALLKAELLKERRVTSKYFCLSYFGVSPPYL